MDVYVVTQNWDYEGAATVGVTLTRERGEQLAQQNYNGPGTLKWITLADPDYTIAQYDKDADYTVTRFEVIE